jgi:ribosomal protein S12 methylthiotransferase
LSSPAAWPSWYREEVAKEIPEADVISGPRQKRRHRPYIQQALEGKKGVAFGEKADLPLSGKRVISNLPFFAYLKVARGATTGAAIVPSRSSAGARPQRSMEDILEEAQTLADAV